MIINSNIELTFKNLAKIRRKASENDPYSNYLLGVAYFLGGVVNVDFKESFSFFKKSYDLGYGPGAFRCGFLIEHKYYESSEKSIDWYNRAASLGCPEGMTAVANIWTYAKLNKQYFFNKWISFNDMSSDAINAYDLYHRASLSKYSPSYYFKGIHLLKGWGIIKNKELAIVEFKAGLETGDKDCAYILSNIDDQSLYLSKAADMGHQDAQYLLAVHNLKYLDYDNVLIWLKRAAAQRNRKSILLLISLYFKNSKYADRLEGYRWAKRAHYLKYISIGRYNHYFNLLTPAEQQMFSFSVNDEEQFFNTSEHLFGKPGLYH